MLSTTLAAFVVVIAQTEAPTFGRSHHGEAFDEGPRQAAYLMEGMSPQVHMAIAGISEEAQKFFDQGLTQLHGFWYFEAERSFRQVAKLHPECAMAYWGMAQANLENDDRATRFMANAVERSANIPRYEQLWVDAFAKYYLIDDARRGELRSGDAAKVKAATDALTEANKSREKAVKEPLDRQLLKDLGTIVYEFPQDTEAKALLAIRNWLASDWGEGIPIVSHTAIDSLLDPVFAKAPLHPAHHYRVHLWDQEVADRALVSASHLGASAPGIAHQWHMAGHIYAKLNRHPEAAWQQAASSRVDHAHMMRDRVMPFEIHNYGHNQEWLSRSLAYQGRVDEALQVARNLAELPRHPEKNRLSEGDDIAAEARVAMVGICTDHELWDEAVHLAQDGWIEPSEAVAADAQRIDLLGRALYRLGRVEEADRVAAEVDGLLVRARDERAKKIDEAEDKAIVAKKDRAATDGVLEEARRYGTDVVRAVLDLKKDLHGEKLLAAGDAKGALEEFKTIEGFPKTLLADAHVAAGEPDKAIELLEEQVKSEPHRMESLARLLRAYRAANKPEQEARRAELTKELEGMTSSTSPLLAKLGITPTVAPGAVRSGDVASFPADFGTRPALDSLGPALWSPVAAPGFELPVAGGGTMNLAQHRGKPIVVVFYLGFGCLHCVEQLKAFGPKAKAFAEAGIDLVAIGADTGEAIAESLAAMSDAERFPFPMLSDPTHAAFKAWRCYDDFEDMALHGTFLVDADGRVRWQDISYRPFTDIDWLLAESKRLLALRIGES